MFIAIALVIVLFSLLVIIHEYGHFLLARRNGIEVEEFGVGFPPRVYGRKFGRTLYSINLLPLGGFVRLKGEDGEDQGKGSFAAASFAARAKVLLAGVAMNLVTAYVILLGLCLTGLPPLMENQFSIGEPTFVQPRQLMAAAVVEESPAASAGLHQGDVILRGNDQSLDSEDELIQFTKANAGREVMLQVSQDGQARDLSVRLRGGEEGKEKGYLGVTPMVTYKLAYGWASPIVALGLLGQLAWATLAGFGGLLAGLLVRREVSESVTGPVGIVAILGNVMNLGVSYLAVFVAMISVSLAVINVLPIPALDGGRMALMTAQRFLKRKLSPQTEALVHTVGFVALLILMGVVTYFDIKRFG